VHVHRRQGQAARRSGSSRRLSIHDIAVERYGLEPGDLFFDPLALTLGTGMEESRRWRAHRGHPADQEHRPAYTTLGLSNISFGLNPPPATS
jgi:5-methyltetrahydrofolate--homocysteine methyltransferase